MEDQRTILQQLPKLEIHGNSTNELIKRRKQIIDVVDKIDHVN